MTSLTDFSLSNESRGEQLVGSRHSDTSTPRHRPTPRHPDTPTLSTLSTLYKEVHCQESPTLADTAPTPPRHCPDTARHPDPDFTRCGTWNRGARHLACTSVPVQPEALAPRCRCRTVHSRGLHLRCKVQLGASAPHLGACTVRSPVARAYS